MNKEVIASAASAATTAAGGAASWWLWLIGHGSAWWVTLLTGVLLASQLFWGWSKYLKGDAK